MQTRRFTTPLKKDTPKPGLKKRELLLLAGD
jgi:hypothetical protein